MDEACFSQGKGHLHLWPIIAVMFHSRGTEPVTDIRNHTKAVNCGIPSLSQKKKSLKSTRLDEPCFLLSESTQQSLM